MHHFATYHYDNINGKGNPNVVRENKYEGDLWRWHFVYFGYSRIKREAYAHIEYASRTVSHKLIRLNHFMVNDLYFWVAKDDFDSTFNGAIA